MGQHLRAQKGKDSGMNIHMFQGINPNIKHISVGVVSVRNIFAMF